MPSPLILLFMIFFLLESMAGVVENGFIIIVLGREWVRCWTLPPGDMILTSLGISRFFLHWAAVLCDFFAYFFLTNRSIYFGIFWIFINSTTLWFTTWLALFYCVKISSFTHPIFLWLKWRISRFVPRLLLCSLLISMLTFISSFVKSYHVFQLPITGNYSEKTFYNTVHAFHQQFFMPLQIFILLINFLSFLFSSILLISSLWRHLGNMQHHSAGPQDPSMQVHIMTLKSVFLFLILYISNVLPLIITVTGPLSVFSPWFWVWEILTYAGISIHPAFLILNNSKLRRALKKMLHDYEAA